MLESIKYTDSHNNSTNKTPSYLSTVRNARSYQTLTQGNVFELFFWGGKTHTYIH